MRRCRFAANGRIHSGISVEDDTVLLDEAGRRHNPDEVMWLPPVEPGEIIGLALNFEDHAKELGFKDPEDPVLFLKSHSSLLGNKGKVIAPPNIEYMHYEVELAVVLGKPGRKIRAADALDYVLGYTIANDVTIRDYVVNMFRPPVKAKGFDTFTPMGPYLVIDEVADPHNLNLRTYVNGELRQEGNTSTLLRDIPTLIEYISEFMTLNPYDVILTGTPEGISHIYPGDELRLEIDGLGALESTVVADE
jgi:5-oxopent-3-ene-1,2,5-tricarboxylate decarboxylase/2-hydroxyhepta-2,4-diene-1,7-dioate isomerase